MKQYIVDAFTDTVFKGNPAAVCIMDSWIEDDLMLSITRENNLSETAFAVKENKKYRLRWFTPGGEIDLCGHATLATAFVITNFYEKNIVSFLVSSFDHFSLSFPSGRSLYRIYRRERPDCRRHDALRSDRGLGAQSQ